MARNHKFSEGIFQLLQFSRQRPSFSAHRAALMTKTGSRQMAFFIFARMGKGRAKVGQSRFRVMLKYFEINRSFMCSNLFRYYIKQIDSMLPRVCSVIDHRRRQNVVRYQ